MVSDQGQPGQIMVYDSTSCDGPPQYETSDELDESMQEECSTVASLPEADEASEQTLRTATSSSNSSFEKEHSGIDSNHTTDIEGDYFQIPIPTYLQGLTTFGHQLAIRNRISDAKLSRLAGFDKKRYTPTFVHDSLMLPGSLATVLGKDSSADVAPRMTPALLPGFSLVPDREDALCIVKSANPSDYVQGMLIFGQGRSGRNRIHDHYRPQARRAKLPVEVDVLVTVPALSRNFREERWRLQRRRILAHAWLSTPLQDDTADHVKIQTWSFSTQSASEMESEESLRISPSGHSDDEEDGGVHVPSDVCTSSPHPREIVYGGSGHLLYDRVEEGWTGW